MTAEDRCQFCKDLLNSKEEVMYMEERIYAVKVFDMVTLVKANNPREAKAKANRTLSMTMNRSGGTQIGYVQNLTI